MRHRGTAAEVSGEQTFAFSTSYEKTSPSKVPPPGWQLVERGCMVLLRSGQREVAEVEQIKRAADGRQILPGDMQETRGGIDGPVPEQELKSPDVDASFKEMRGKAVPQRMDALAVYDPRSPLGVRGALLGGPDRHRLCGVLSRK